MMTVNADSNVTPSPAFSPRLHGLALLFYGLLAFLILHPLIFHNGTHVAGYDYFNYHWNQWWIRHALTTPGLSLYESNYVLAPSLNNLGYHALTPFWFPLWAVLEPFFGSLTAINVIIFVGAVLNGYALFGFLRSEGVSPALALIGGAALQVAPVTRFFYYNTHINLMDWFWLPVHFLLWKQVLSAAKHKSLSRLVLWSVAHGLALWALFHTDLQFPIFVAFLLVPYGLWTFITHPNKGRLVIAAAIVIGLAGVLLWVAGPLPAILAFEGELVPGTVDDRPGIPFPGGYLSTYDEWWEWNTPTLGGFVTVGMLLSIVVSLSPFRKRLPAKRWLWLALLIPPLLFTMGPDITLAGVQIPMPFRLLHSVTDGMFRFPWRLAPIYLMAAITFCAITWTPLLRGRLLPVSTALLLVLALDARIFQTGPIEPVLTDYSFYHTMRDEPYDYVVIEAPTGFGTGEILLGNAEAIRFQYYGTIHEKRMVNGFLSRVPIDDYWYLRTDDPMLSWLGQRRYLEPELVEAQLRERIPEWPIGYLVLHTDLIGVHGPTVQEIVGYLNSLPDLLCPYTVEGAAIVYRTTWHPDGCESRIPPQDGDGAYSIDIGNTGDEAFIGWGWHWPEEVAGLGLRWAGEYPQADLYFDLPPAAYTLSFAAQAFWEAREVTVLLNGSPLGEAVTVQPDTLQTFSFTVPVDLLADGSNLHLSLVYDAVIVPEEVGQSADTRRLSIALDWLKFTQDTQP